MKKIGICLLILMLGLNLVSCSNMPFADRIDAAQPDNFNNQTQLIVKGNLSEVATPPLIQELNKSFQQYNPQVSILSPKSDQVFSDDRVSVKLQVKDLPIFKHPELAMGPHLHLILDNEPYRPVYDTNKPVVLENLAPGTHTLRAFASRPWHESFKNEGAYAQTTFHILTKTKDNNPDPSLPLLTYSRPNGTYGAEPIMLDFYLTNAPLHLVAQENPEYKDWRIRVTINGESFVLDNWQSIYLKGFEKGKNWVQLEFIDEDGNVVKNVFNDTVRLIDYDPKQKDTLAQLVQGKLSLEVARAIVEPNYQAKPIPTPKIEETPESKPEIPAAKPSEEAPSAEIPIAPPEIEKPQETPTSEIPIAPPEITVPETLDRPKAEVPIAPKSSTPEVKEPVINEEEINTSETENKVEEIPSVEPEKTATEKPQWLLGLQNRWQQVKESVSKSVSKIKLPKSKVKTTAPSESKTAIEEESKAIEKTEIPEEKIPVENEINSES
ncbi:MAG: hypothetical protein ACRC2R_27660 [Xenococcaceae cyanobacterium]